MSNSFFKFKQFTIYHDRCGMKVGTDGVLLGAWCDVEQAKRVLDVGTGSGLIALQIAQRNPTAQVVGVEIEEAAAGQAADNAARSPWQERIQIICTDYKSFEDGQKFDAIVSNPPYFVDALRSPDAQRRLARHIEGLNYDVLFRHSPSLLAAGGRICIITPAEVEKLVQDTAWNFGFHPSRLTRVFTKPGKPCRRILWEFSAAVGPCVEETLYIEAEGGGYSDAYVALTHDFYLNM